MLVVRGEAGVGKTALLDYCTSQASDLRVTRIAGVESEVELPFAALHQLCAPMLDHLDALALPQQRALRVAFGLAFGDPPDRFQLSLAVLTLAAEVATERPLLCIVDDAQWLDAPSAQVLGFVARRLIAESVAMVFADRQQADAGALAALPDLAVDGLAPGDARTLLHTAVAGPLDQRVRDRLIAETRGNPLALLELAPTMAATPAPNGIPRELSGRIERRFLERLEGLDDDARRLLLVASAEPVGDPATLWRAAERLGIDAGALPLETGGLLTVGERVTFVHPLARSAVYRSASPVQRRAVHLALARVTDAPADRDRRAWHLAAAAPGPDEEAAGELEWSAGRAQARGGFAAAAAFLHRSVALTRDSAQRTARALAAARASLHAGAFDDARDALAAAEAGTLDELEGAQVELVRGHIAFAAGSAADASALLLSAARRLEPLDLPLARETYLGALGAAMFAGPACARDLLEVGRAVRALPDPAEPPRAIDVLLDGLALLVCEGRAAAAPTLLEATDAFAGDDVPIEESLRWSWMATAGSNALWDDDGLRAVCGRNIGLARHAGALLQLPIHLIALGAANARAGDLAGASSLIAEADAVTEATGTRLAPFAAELVIASLRGREAELLELKQAAVEHAASSGQGMPATVAEWSEAMLYNGLGRYEAALKAARRASSAAGDLFAAMWALPELVEAATRVGAADIAQDAFERLVEATSAAGTDYGLGMQARSRALLSERVDAEPHYREAIERLGRTHMRSELARARLLHGEWLRRAGRRKDAREQLGAAHAMFLTMDMTAFAERAGRELLATGERVRGRAAESRDRLTPQEAQIAGLAREGLSNAEIAARLFISPRTVEWHLKKVFTKLGISSRRGLRDSVPSAASNGADQAAGQ